MACATMRRRSGVGVLDGGADCVLLVAFLDVGNSDFIKARQAGFRPRSAFCKLSWWVRPIAITSPTDFMAVVRIGDEPGNFSNANADLGDDIVDRRPRTRQVLRRR